MKRSAPRPEASRRRAAPHPREREGRGREEERSGKRGRGEPAPRGMRRGAWPRPLQRPTAEGRARRDRREPDPPRATPSRERREAPAAKGTREARLLRGGDEGERRVSDSSKSSVPVLPVRCQQPPDTDGRGRRKGERRDDPPLLRVPKDRQTPAEDGIAGDEASERRRAAPPASARAARPRPSPNAATPSASGTRPSARSEKYGWPPSKVPEPQ